MIPYETSCILLINSKHKIARQPLLPITFFMGSEFSMDCRWIIHPGWIFKESNNCIDIGCFPEISTSILIKRRQLWGEICVCHRLTYLYVLNFINYVKMTSLKIVQFLELYQVITRETSLYKIILLINYLFLSLPGPITI